MKESEILRSHLPPDMQASFSEKLTQHRTMILEKTLESDARLSKYIFTTNAGGAVAVLAFIGTNGADSRYGWTPLICFVLGVIASGIEVRSLAEAYSALL